MLLVSLTMTPRPNSQLTNWFLPVLALTEMIAAAPYAEVQARDATSVGVQLLYPHSETTWWAGQWHNITWYALSANAVERP